MQRKVQQKQSTAQQVLIPIIIDPVEQPEEPVVTPRPGGEKIPPGGWRGAETPRPGGEKIPPGGWRSDDDDLNPGDWRSQFRLPVLTPVDAPPLTTWDGEVYRTTDGVGYFHFKTVIAAHIIPPEEVGTGSVFATLVEYWTPGSGLVTIEDMANSEVPTPPLVALARMSTHVAFEAEGAEEIHQAFTQLQSQLSIWAETLWTYINEQETESEELSTLDEEEEI